MFRQLTCRELLFTNYDCPQTEKKVSFYIECNFIAYVISGRRIFHKNNQSWELKEGSCVFVKKGAHIAERENDEGWCVMVFFMPDDFLKQLIRENRNGLSLAPPAGNSNRSCIAPGRTCDQLLFFFNRCFLSSHKVRHRLKT